MTSASAQAFLAWLRGGLADGTIPANCPRASVHYLPEGLFLISPRVFRRYDKLAWRSVQRDVLRAKFHVRGRKGDFLACSVAGRRCAKINGILIPEPETKLGIRLLEPNLVLALRVRGGEWASPRDRL